MHIRKYTLISEEELLMRLKQTRLKGFDRFPIYKDADLRVLERVNINTLVPPQRYVLIPTVDAILQVADAFLEEGIDIFALRGAIMFWPETLDPAVDPPIPLLPPIVEESREENGAIIPLVNDGMHRISAAYKRGRRPNIVLVSNVPQAYPYYAYGFEGGWNNLDWFVELPDTYEKKKYRNPENYKALFRMFNEVFPGVQAERKNSNPAHIKA